MQWRHGSGAVRRAFALMPINIQLRMNCARFEWSGPKIAPDGLRMVLHHLQVRATHQRLVLKGSKLLQRLFKCVMQARPLPQPPALCHTMCRTVGNKQLQRVFKCVVQAQLPPQTPALCHTICSARNSRAPLAAGFEEGQAAAAVVQRRIQIRFIMRTVAQVTLQAQPLPQPPALCHTM